jgi:hypothetical protein
LHASIDNLVLDYALCFLYRPRFITSLLEGEILFLEDG